MTTNFVIYTGHLELLDQGNVGGYDGLGTLNTGGPLGRPRRRWEYLR